MEFKIGHIVLITKVYSRPVGKNKRGRVIGYITGIKEESIKQDGSAYVILNPLPRRLAKEFREKYCTEEYNYQGIYNSYSDDYGFACDNVSPETTIILGVYNKPEIYHWYPKPGNTGYDLMC